MPTALRPRPLRLLLLLLLAAAAQTTRTQTFPPPRWAPTWNLTQSTVINPGITDGYFSPNHTWGLISPDWSCAQGIWMQEYCGALLQEPACNSSWPGCGACNSTDNSTTNCGPRLRSRSRQPARLSSSRLSSSRLSSSRLSAGAGSWPQSGSCSTPGRNTTTCEATSVEGCRRLKASGKASRCFIYHNHMGALEWLETQRAVMYDDSKADWFLMYTDGAGNKNGSIYQRNAWEGDQFLWDYRVPAAADYVIDSIVRSVNGSDSAVDGTYTDDIYNGTPDQLEATTAILVMQNETNITDAELTDLRLASTATYERLVHALIAVGKYSWQAFASPWSNGPGAGINHTTCEAFMAKHCAPHMQELPLMMDAGSSGASVSPTGLAAGLNETLAAFLIVRPPIAYLGWGWESDDGKWPRDNATGYEPFLLQPGVPRGECKSEGGGRYSREWSSGVVRLDCGQWSSDLPFPSL